MLCHKNIHKNSCYFHMTTLQLRAKICWLGSMASNRSLVNAGLLPTDDLERA